MRYFGYNTELGKVFISQKDDKISGVSFSKPAGEEIETPLLHNAYIQLCEYMQKKRKIFNLPLLFEGTAFQHKVWAELVKIPYGKTISYKNLAKNIGNPKCARAVGQACNKNKLLFFVPCHRVISQDKKLTGFAVGLNKKRQLLEIEGVSVD